MGMSERVYSLRIYSFFVVVHPNKKKQLHIYSNMLPPTYLTPYGTPGSAATRVLTGDPFDNIPIGSLNTLQMLTESMESRKRPRSVPGTPVGAAPCAAAPKRARH